MALPRKTVERLATETSTIIRWIDAEHPELLEDFVLAFCGTIKSCKTTHMDAFFAPLMKLGITIPEPVLESITAFTQETVNYQPRQRSIVQY